MSYQPSHTTKVDVGTPSAEFLSSESFYWSDFVEVRFHDFVGEVDSLEEMGGGAMLSPEFTVFGHQWQLKLILCWRLVEVNLMTRLIQREQRLLQHSSPTV